MLKNAHNMTVYKSVMHCYGTWLDDQVILNGPSLREGQCPPAPLGWHKLFSRLPPPSGDLYWEPAACQGQLKDSGIRQRESPYSHESLIGNDVLSASHS